MSDENSAPTEAGEGQPAEGDKSKDQKVAASPKATELEEGETPLLEDTLPKKEEKLIEEKPKPIKGASEKKQEIINAYVEKLKEPDFKIEDVPKWVIKELGIGEEEKPAVVEKKPVDFNENMAKYESQKQFEADKALLKSLPLELRNQLTTAANELKSDLNVPISKALNSILKRSGERIAEELGHSANRNFGAGMPSAGKQPVGKGFITEGQLAKLSQADYNKTMIRVDKGELKIQKDN